ncbi:Exonuclease SbcC [uncultured Candidatus Thioglobus sp.]|nr:Exonuclease SbcC [uncultured Candidatus Thioglobus sp.]
MKTLTQKSNKILWILSSVSILLFSTGCSVDSGEQPNVKVNKAPISEIDFNNNAAETKIVQLINQINYNAEQAEILNANNRQFKLTEINTNKESQLNQVDERVIVEIQQLDQQQKVELIDKKNLLDIQNKSNIKTAQSNAKNQQQSTITQIEKQISSVRNQVDDELDDKLLRTESKNISNAIILENKLQKQHNEKVNKAEKNHNLQAKQKTNSLEKEISQQEIYNKNLVKLKSDELEARRVLIAGNIKQAAKKKNSGIVNKIKAQQAAVIKKQRDALKAKLSKEGMGILNKLNAKFDAEKTTRKQKDEKRIRNLNSKNKDIVIEASKKTRSDLIPVQKSRLAQIDENLKERIKQIGFEGQEDWVNSKSSIYDKYAEKTNMLEENAIQKRNSITENARQNSEFVNTQYNEQKNAIETDRINKISKLENQ